MAPRAGIGELRGPLFLALAAVLFVGTALHGAEVTPLTKLSAEELNARVRRDVASVRTYRKGLQAILAYMRSEPKLFPQKKLEKPRLLKTAQKDTVRSTWKSALDYVLALDSIGRYHQKYYRLKGKALKRDSLAVFFGAFLAQYAFALEFLALAQNDDGLDTLLNEPIPELGLSKGTYADFKFRFLNAGRATEFAALTSMHKFLGESKAAAKLSAGIAVDKRLIWRAGRGTGPLMTLKNAGTIVKRASFTAWFPVQVGVSEWMGDTKVLRRGRSLITEKQAQGIIPRLRPGDVLLERREWYLSNVGLPGFWPHAALYVGTPEEHREFFGDPTVRAWVRKQGTPSGDLNERLRTAYPKAYAASLKPAEDSHPRRVFEAQSEGVVFNSLEHSAMADSVVVLRPRLSKQDKARALMRALKYHGRPYDFDFDFGTDQAIVCTELVYKTYEPAAGFKGLRLPLTEMMGRLVTPANEIARQFDEQFGTPKQQTDMILFLDGHERSKKAVEADVKAFRASWRRPKWHIIVQGTWLDK